MYNTHNQYCIFFTSRSSSDFKYHPCMPCFLLVKYRISNVCNEPGTIFSGKTNKLKQKNVLHLMFKEKTSWIFSYHIKL